MSIPHSPTIRALFVKHRASHLLKLSVIVAIASSCGNATSRLAHNENSPVIDTAAWQWQHEPDAAFEAGLRSAPGFQSVVIEPPNSDRTLEMDAVMRVLDTSWRDLDPVAFQHVPPPRPRVYSGGINAMAHNVPLCFTLAPKNQALQAIAYDAGRGEFAPPAKVLPTCPRFPFDHPTVDSFREWIAARYPGCVIAFNTRDGKTSVDLSDRCPGISRLKTIDDFDTLIIAPMSDAIAFATGLWRGMTSDERAFVAAHEMAHYYRAHPIWGDSPAFGFYYDDRLAPKGKRPLPDPRVADLGARVARAARVYWTTFEQPHGPTRFPLTLLTPELMGIARSKAGGACDALMTWADSPAVRPLLMSIAKMRTTPVNAETLAAYETFETRFVGCAARLPVPAKIPSLRRFLPKDDPLGADVTIDNATSALDIADRLAATVRAWRNDARATLDEAADRRLGWYTDEQEADEMALEMMAMNAWNIEAGPRAVRAILSDPAGLVLDPGEITPSECLKWDDRGFLDDSGAPIVVPVGEYRDGHHPACYRLFNIRREIKGHSWTR